MLQTHIIIYPVQYIPTVQQVAVRQKIGADI